MINNDKFKENTVIIIVLLFAVFSITPLIIFGTNSIITIHDNLDQMIPYYKMYKDNNLFFKFDAPAKGFSDMSTLYYGHVNFSFTPLLYNFFNDFHAYAINNIISIIFGFISMYLLLKKIGNIDNNLIILISLCFSILPVGPNLSIAVSTLPFIFAVFISFVQKEKFSLLIFLLLFYPFFSAFTMTGIFILGFWLLGFIVLWIKSKKLNINLLVGFIMLCVGYILVDLRLFYVIFILKTELNRSIFSSSANIRQFFKHWLSYGINGHYHAASFQRLIIIPAAFIISIFSLIIIIIKIKKLPGKLMNRIKTVISETDNTIKHLFIMELIIILFSVIAALHDSHLIEEFIESYIPVLKGFNWGRVWIFNRVLWYIVFVYCLQIILNLTNLNLNIDIMRLNIGKIIRKGTASNNIIWLFAVILIILQLSYAAFTPVRYNDQIKTWFNGIFIKTGIARKMWPQKTFNNFISYKDFFSKDLFEKIKEDIIYSDERVLAFGFHPSVLMYNGFNVIDGYMNSYPLSYMRRFRTLIAPELEVNQKAREYFDDWGGRMYLYNSILNYAPTRDKNTTPVNLNIDINVFSDNFNAVYILSRAEILNCDNLGLILINRYSNKESIYIIYLYKKVFE